MTWRGATNGAVTVHDTPSIMERDQTIPAMTGAMMSAAHVDAADDVLRRLGRHLMAKTPLVEGIGPYEDPEEVPEIAANPQIETVPISSRVSAVGNRRSLVRTAEFGPWTTKIAVNVQ